MGRYVKRCSLVEIPNCRNLEDGEAYDCWFRTENGYCCDPQFYLTEEEIEEFEEANDYEADASVLLAAVLVECLAQYED